MARRIWVRITRHQASFGFEALESFRVAISDVDQADQPLGATRSYCLGMRYIDED